MVHDSVLFRLCLLHIKADEGIVGQHLQLVGAEEIAQFLKSARSGSQIAVQAFGLDVNAVEAVFFTQGQVLQNGVARAEAVAAFVKANFHCVHLHHKNSVDCSGGRLWNWSYA